jgi:hypothetical protein
MAVDERAHAGFCRFIHGASLLGAGLLAAYLL